MNEPVYENKEKSNGKRSNVPQHEQQRKPDRWDNDAMVTKVER